MEFLVEVLRSTRSDQSSLKGFEPKPGCFVLFDDLKSLLGVFYFSSFVVRSKECLFKNTGML